VAFPTALKSHLVSARITRLRRAAGGPDHVHDHARDAPANVGADYLSLAPSSTDEHLVPAVMDVVVELVPPHRGGDAVRSGIHKVVQPSVLGAVELQHSRAGGASHGADSVDRVDGELSADILGEKLTRPLLIETALVQRAQVAVQQFGDLGPLSCSCGQSGPSTMVQVKPSRLLTSCNMPEEASRSPMRSQRPRRRGMNSSDNNT
jgi:hypothetical protein